MKDFLLFHNGKLNIFTHVIGFPITFIGIFQIDLFLIFLGLGISEISHIYNHFTQYILYTKKEIYIQIGIVLVVSIIYFISTQFI